MHWALLLTIALRIEPNPPLHGESATLTIETRNLSAPLRVEVSRGAMLRRVPEGAAVSRTPGQLELLWQQPPQRVQCELVLRAGSEENWLSARATSGTDSADLGIKPVWRHVERPSNNGLLAALIAAGLALSLLIWPTVQLIWRHQRSVAVICALAGTGLCVLFVMIWWANYSTTNDYRQGSCFVTDRMLVERGSMKGTRSYSPMFAVELDGHPRIAGDSDSVGYNYVKDQADEKLAKFEVGKTYPCWWSVRDRDEVLLEPRRSQIVTTTLVTAGVLLLMAVPGWIAPATSRRRSGARRKTSFRR